MAPNFILWFTGVAKTSSGSEDLSFSDLIDGFISLVAVCRVKPTFDHQTANPRQTSSESEEVFDPVLLVDRKIPLDPIEGLALRQHRRHPAHMIRLKPLPDDVAILDQSHIFRGARLILAYVAELGPIPLTPSKAFKRVFVNWAAEAFVWPHWTVTDLYRVNKVLNEYDFGPLEVLHHLLIDLKLGRHYKGTFRLTKVGQGLVAKPKDLFEILVPFFLFNVNHGYYSRFGHEPFRDWDAGLNVLNIEAENGVSLGEFCAALYGPVTRDREQQRRAESELYTGILRPLCWAGLLDEHRSRGAGLAANTYQKTALWPVLFALQTDGRVRPAVRH